MVYCGRICWKESVFIAKTSIYISHFSFWCRLMHEMRKIWRYYHKFSIDYCSLKQIALINTLVTTSPACPSGFNECQVLTVSFLVEKSCKYVSSSWLNNFSKLHNTNNAHNYFNYHSTTQRYISRNITNNYPVLSLEILWLDYKILV